ncbi:MAG: hypothetical protein NCW75_12325 [Phycisphaera sp.]|nr:MAG: hypothetical protein NCW75_12325 [Phycisphaera sp.]
MAKKAARPASGITDPTQSLLQALSQLHTLCLSAGLFHELAKRRERQWATHAHLRDAQAQAAIKRANDLAESGASPLEQLEAAFNREQDSTETPVFSEPDQYIEYLRVKLAEGRDRCEQARSAMQAGAGKVLDAATQPNTAGQPRSIELHTKLQQARSIFIGLAIGLSNPQIVIEDDAANMASLGEWFSHILAELIAVGELVPGAPTSETREGVTISQLLDALNCKGGISTDTFGRIRKAAGIKSALGRAAANYRYTPEEMDRIYETIRDGNWDHRVEMMRDWAGFTLSYRTNAA